MSRSLAGHRLPLGGIEAPAPSARRPALAVLPAALAALAAALSLVLAASLVAPGAWFASLDTPFFMPPLAVLGATWVLMALPNAGALYLLLRARPTDDRRLALSVMAAQLLLHLLWLPALFGIQSPGAALGVVLLLDLALLAAQFTAQRVHAGAAWLLLPCLAWSLFASLLHLALWSLNP